jgi:hypothetical protein
MSVAFFACVPSAGPSPAHPASSAPVEAELRAAPPPADAASPGAAESLPASAAPAPGSASSAASSVTTSSALAAAEVAPEPPPPDPSLECVDPPDPELDKESPWGRELGQRLERELARLQSCTRDLPEAGDQAITLRLVYQKDGSPVSQHVVTSTPGACAASDCLKRELAKVHSSKLLIDKASLDLTLSLKRGAAPERSSGAVDPLTPDEVALASTTDASNGCVDPEVARLSHAKVREIVSTIYPRLQTCYGQALVRDHHAGGKVAFEFVIGQNGGVSEAWAREASFRDCIAIRCMLSEFRTLNFPEPVGRAVRVIYPISYRVEQAPVTLR